MNHEYGPEQQQVKNNELILIHFDFRNHAATMTHLAYVTAVLSLGVAYSSIASIEKT